MRAIDPAMGANIGQAVSADAEVESLLAGLSRASPEAAPAGSLMPSAESAIEAALSDFAAALQAQFDRASVPLFVEPGRPCTASLAPGGTALSRTIESARPVELICNRELVACMVDYRFGGAGVAALADPSRPLSVTERRALDSLLNSVAQVWDSHGAMLEEAARHGFADQSPMPGRSMTVALSVRAGAGKGTLVLASSALEIPTQMSVGATDCEGVTLIARLAQIRLSGEAAQSLSVGDMIAFSLPRSIEVTCIGVKLRCLHGARNGRHALRVLSVSSVTAMSEPAPAGEIEYALELGRRVLSREALEAINAGDTISFDQTVDAPLPLTREGRCCGYAEVVVVADGHALRIVEWRP